MGATKCGEFIGLVLQLNKMRRKEEVSGEVVEICGVKVVFGANSNGDVEDNYDNPSGRSRISRIKSVHRGSGQNARNRSGNKNVDGGGSSGHFRGQVNTDKERSET